MELEDIKEILKTPIETPLTEMQREEVVSFVFCEWTWRTLDKYKDVFDYHVSDRGCCDCLEKYNKRLACHENDCDGCEQCEYPEGGEEYGGGCAECWGQLDVQFSHIPSGRGFLFTAHQSSSRFGKEDLWEGEECYEGDTREPLEK